MEKEDKRVAKFNYYTLFRVLISLVLILYIFTLVETQELIPIIRSVEITFFLIATFLTFASFSVASLRWQFVLRFHHIRTSIFTLYKIYLIGALYNLIMPTSLGGDVFRAIKLSEKESSRRVAITSIFFERLLGLFGLVFISIISLFFSRNIIMIENSHVTTLVTFIFVIYLVGIALLFNKNFVNSFINLLGIFSPRILIDKLVILYDIFYSYKNKRGVFVRTFVLSIIYQFLGILTVYFLGISIGIQLDFTLYLILLPMIWLISMVPASLNGLGIREGAFVYFFTKVGVTVEIALVLSLLFLIQNLILGFAGGVVNLLSFDD